MVILELQSWITIAESLLHQAIHFCDDVTMKFGKFYRYTEKVGYLALESK